MDDVERLKDHYAQRAECVGDHYAPTRADVALYSAELDVATVRALRREGMTDFPSLTLLEVGSGGGGNLLRLVRWGFRPEHLTGCELIKDRHDHATTVVPPGVRLVNADARTLGAQGSFDIAYQATVLSSILDDEIQEQVARTMWDAVRPGGLVMSLDFTFDNPRNDQVRAVPKRRLAELFPGELHTERVHLAPPLARRIGWHPAAHLALRTLPFLRTHLLATIRKPGRPS